MKARPDARLALVSELLAALAHAHTPRTAVRAIATTLARRAPVTRVALTVEDARAVATLVDGEWRCTDEPGRLARAAELVPGLAVALARGAPAGVLLADPELRFALGQVVDGAVRHLAVVQRIAGGARRAHATRRALEADLERLAAPTTLVAHAPAMRAVLERVALVARHPTTVLVTGESGTGKEVVAREIHRRSPRAHRPLVQLNCAAIPEALVEAELFGHERGAFTGADRARAGVFERADRGTLLLDELGDLPLAAQAKLLRVLQERQVHRLGGAGPIAVDVRVIAATNRPLAALVEAGRFRRDLYYRLDVLTIALPPLRDRREDLAPLAAALLASLATRLDLPVPRLTRAHLARLEAHDWPGNVRELANVLEAALVLGAGRELELPAGLGAAPPARLRPFDESVRRAIEAALRASRGKLYGPGGAAERLGLEPTTLQSKMRRLGIERARFTQA